MFPINTDLLDAVSSTWTRRPGVILFGIEGCITDSTMDAALVPGMVVATALLRLPHMQPIFITNKSEYHSEEILDKLLHLFESRNFRILFKTERYQHLDEPQYKLRALLDQRIEPQHVVVAFDAQTAVVEAYRKLGIKAYHTGG